MNIHEIAEKFQVSLHKVKRMRGAGVLICDPGDGHPLASAMRANLVKGRNLSVAQMFVLLKEPAVFAELRTRQRDARLQIEALDDFEADKPAMGLVPHFVDAAENQPASVAAIIRWLKAVLPADGSEVSHAWIAVRIAQLVADENARNDFLQKVARALHFCRLNPDFAGWHADKMSGSKKSKIYFRPTQKKLANFDM